jgi:hypothetical protein
MAEPGPWLFDPSATRRLVLAHRGAGDPAVRCVVSDVVWSEVVVLLRWARASTQGTTASETGVLWRLAAGCGDLLRRLPALSDEIDEPWRPAPSVDARADLPGRARIDRVAGRLTRLLTAPGPVPLVRLTVEVDALGEAAIGALVERTTTPSGEDA